MYIIFVVYYLGDSRLDYVISVLKRFFPYATVVLVINRKSNYTPILDDVCVVSGTNWCLDIGAYKDGYEYVKKNFSFLLSDYIIFLNDSIAHKHGLLVLLTALSVGVKYYEGQKYLYSGITSIKSVAGKRSVPYFSTYCILANIGTIDFFCKEIIFFMRSSPNDINLLLSESNTSRWRPLESQRPVSLGLIRKKERCVKVEMTLSVIATHYGFFYPLPRQFYVKGFRFFKKAFNYLGRISKVKFFG